MACCLRNFRPPFYNHYLHFKLLSPQRQSCLSLLPSNKFLPVTNDHLGVIGLHGKKSLKTAVKPCDSFPKSLAISKDVFPDINSNDIITTDSATFLPPRYVEHSLFLVDQDRLLSNDLHRIIVLHRRSDSDAFRILLENTRPELFTDSVSDFVRPNYDELFYDSSKEISKTKSKATSPKLPESLQCAGPSNSAISGKPSESHLREVHQVLANCLPKFFHGKHNYTIYSDNVIFEDGIRGLTTKGCPAYRKQLFLVKVLGRLRYAKVQMEVLKITEHPEDGTVRVRWRVKGKNGIVPLVMFWKLRQAISYPSVEYIDGFSIFYLGPDGLVYKHICDKMMPDESLERSSPTFAQKLALKLGLVRQGGFSHFTKPLQITSASSDHFLSKDFHRHYGIYSRKNSARDKLSRNNMPDVLGQTRLLSMYITNREKPPVEKILPSETHLQKIHAELAERLPKFYDAQFNFDIYSNDIIYEDHIRNISTKGLMKYVKKMAFAKFSGKWNYSKVYMEVSKITSYPEDGTVCVLWTIKGNKWYRNLMPWNIRKAKEHIDIEYTDGISIYYVGVDGKINMHKCDKRIPDEETLKSRGEIVKKTP